MAKIKKTKKTTLTVEVEYNPRKTDPEGLACAMDRLLETALSIPGIMDEYGNPAIREFFVAKETETEAALKAAGLDVDATSRFRPNGWPQDPTPMLRDHLDVGERERRGKAR